jgi:hypothetical protein
METEMIKTRIAQARTALADLLTWLAEKVRPLPAAPIEVAGGGPSDPKPPV